MVGDRAQAVNIGNVVAGGQRLALRDRAADRHRTRRCVIDVGHSRRGRTGHRFHRAMTIGIRGLGHDRRAHIRLTQNVGCAGRACVHHPSVPVVGDRAQAVDVSNVVAGRQGLTLGSRAADSHRAGGRIVDIDHRCRGGAGHGLGCSVAVGEGGLGDNGGANVCFGQGIG